MISKCKRSLLSLLSKRNGGTAAAKSLQSCPTLCDPTDGSPLGCSVSGILQARILEWVAISLSNPWKWKEKVKSLSRARLLATPWTAAYQSPPSMGFSRQEYWSRVPLLAAKNIIHDAEENEVFLFGKTLNLTQGKRIQVPALESHQSSSNLGCGPNGH